MKRYRIIHNTEYKFSDAVQLLPHTLRLRPKEDHELRIESSKLDIHPNATIRWHRDVEGNSVSIASFTDKTFTLKVSSDILIQQYNITPLDFIVADHAVNYPFQYLNDEKIMLAPYLKSEVHSTVSTLGPHVEKLMQGVSNLQTVSLLLKLNLYINNLVAYRLREEEGVQSPAETLSCGTGSCRDSANLFIAIAKELGFAARFVSGYMYSNLPINQSGSTHAWSEVFIPGAGWKGFDPTTGVIVGPQHIAVSVARTAEAVPPIAGTFIGKPGAVMKVEVWVSEVLML